MFYLTINNKKIKIKNNKFATKSKANIERIYLQPDYIEQISIKERG